MSERSVRCPNCAFSFARLVDAGGYRAYHCPTCEWVKPTSDTRPKNRPADVCALCDAAIDLATSDHHLYLGHGWVHGAGRSTHIPVHRTCLESIGRFLRTETMWTDDCSCPERWSQINDGAHMIGCQHYDGPYEMVVPT